MAVGHCAEGQRRIHAQYALRRLNIIHLGFPAFEAITIEIIRDLCELLLDHGDVDDIGEHIAVCVGKITLQSVQLRHIGESALDMGSI